MTHQPPENGVAICPLCQGSGQVPTKEAIQHEMRAHLRDFQGTRGSKERSRLATQIVELAERL